MTLHTWLAFVAASAVLLVIPGPTVLLVVGDALANGSRRAWATVAGVGSADAIAMALSLAGAGALLRASAAAFTVLKTLGGCYLVYLGARSILQARRAKAQPVSSTPSADAAFARAKAPTLAARFGKAWAITVSNPKSILFFIAFVPQFISPHASFLLQSGILLATFTCLSILNSGTYSCVAGLVGNWFSTASAQRRVGYAGGCALIGAGALTLAMKRG
jgi:threonine/homoserine/homoserine lactone efflux protein